MPEQRVEKLLGRSAAGGPGAEHHALSIVTLCGNRHAGIIERKLRGRHGVDGGAVHPPHFHRRHERRRVEAADLGGDRRTAAGGVESSQPDDAGAACEQRVAKRVECRAEDGHHAESCDAHRITHGPYVTIAAMSVPLRRSAIHALMSLAALSVLARNVTSAPPDSFDELYARGKQMNDGLKTLTARFTETTTSTLLTRPLVARGRVAVERPSRVILRYSEPDARTILIDGNTMTVVWPSRKTRQVTHIHTTT